jgi:hypothetical protein
VRKRIVPATRPQQEQVEKPLSLDPMIMSVVDGKYCERFRQRRRVARLAITIMSMRKVPLPPQDNLAISKNYKALERRKTKHHSFLV